jgi:hypothetical protein
MWYIYPMVYYSARMKNEIIYRKMDGTGDHHFEQNKPSSKIQILHGFTICGI